VWLGNSKLSGPWMENRPVQDPNEEGLGLLQLSARGKTGCSYAHSPTDGRKGKTVMAIYLNSEQYITCSAVPLLLKVYSICRYLMDSYGLNY
jgi:hypothetical protein